MRRRFAAATDGRRRCSAPDACLAAPLTLPWHGARGHPQPASAARNVTSVSHAERWESTFGIPGLEKRIPLTTADGKVGGVVVGGILTKNIRMSVHALRNPPALAIDAGILAQAEALGVVQIAITDLESGRTYRATIGDLYRHGWKFDRGFGAQYAMRLTRWAVDGKPSQPEPTPAAAATQDAGQLALGL